MHGKYTCTFFSNEIARVSFNKSQQTNIAREGFENLSSPKATSTWCHVPQTLKTLYNLITLYILYILYING